MTVNQPSVLTTADYYLPGYKGGGPIRTLANTVDQLGDDFRFKVITSDRDLGDHEPYPEIVPNSWRSVGKAEVYYLPPESLSLQALRKIICTAEHDVLYLNSFFSPSFTIKPLLLRRLGLVSKVPVILAPRGELSAGALTLKAPKKRLYLAVAKAFGLYRGLIWQASSPYEAENIRRWFGDECPVVIAPNLPAPSHGAEKQLHRREKVAGRLKAVFLSRISRMKNLRGALTMFEKLKGDVQFNIFGPLEDIGYWEECQKAIRLLPPNIQVQYRGGVAHDEVAEVLADHDLFFLPTLGENFGHVISEALLAGCPVLISDRTPWRSLQEKGIGWDFPLEQPGHFIKTLQGCVEMGAKEHELLSRRARAFALEQAQDRALLDRYRGLFESVLRLG